VQQIQQNGLLTNLFVHIDDGTSVSTWNAAEARFSRVAGEPYLLLGRGSWQRYSADGVLNFLSFDNHAFPLAGFVTDTEAVQYKPADLYLPQLFAPTPDLLRTAGSAGQLRAEGHARLASPLYALTAMAMALTAILGGAFSRTGYGLRVAKAAAAFLGVRIMGYGLMAAGAWNDWVNVLQYVLPLAAAAVALRLLFRALKPGRASRATRAAALRVAPS
jgi:lipopolysaccharide export system permease protein